MAYGEIKVDTITFTDGGIDKSVSISGLVQNPTFSGNITVTGTISGNTLQGQTVSGVTVTGTTAAFTTGTFISLTGTTIQGTTATYTTGSFTSLTGTTTEGTTATYTTGSFTSLTGTTISGTTAIYTTGTFTSLTGTTTTGTTATFASGVFTTQISGATITGNAAAFTTVTGGVATITSGVFALGTNSLPSISFSSDPNTGIYSPGADQLAISTNGTGRLFVDASGRIAVGGTTVTDSHLLNIQGSTAIHNVGVVLNKTNGTAQVWGIQNNGSFNVYNYTAASTALTIDTSNRVGLGTSSPSSALHVAGTGSPAIQVQTTGANQFGYFIAKSPNREYHFGVNDASSGSFYLYDNTAAATRLAINSSGNVGVGTSSPGYTLDVTGAGRHFSSVTDAASLYLSKTNSGTADQGGNKIYFTNTGPAATGRASGTLIGALQFQASEPSSGGLKNCGAIEVTADGVQSGVFTPTKLQISTSDTVFSGNRVAMTIDSSQRVGVGTTSPSNNLNVIGIADFDGGAVSTTSRLRIQPDEATKTVFLDSRTATGNSELAIKTGAAGGSTERLRIDGSGRLLVGTSSTSQVGTLLLQGRGSATGSAIARLCTTDATPANGASIGIVAFGDSGHTTAAQISVVRDGGTWTSGTSQPTRLVFSTTADGASSPTERMRITSAGVLQIADAGDITVGTTTGTKIGTATTQKLGFWNATPAVQPAAVADATDAASVITQLNDLLAKLRTLGIIAT